MSGDAVFGEGGDEGCAANGAEVLGAGEQLLGPGIGAQRRDGLLEQMADPAGSE